MRVPPTYAEAKALATTLWGEVEAAAKPLKAFPRNPSGLTPDQVRESPEYQAAKATYEAAFRRLQAFNRVFVRRFAKEYRADRDRERMERI